AIELTRTVGFRAVHRLYRADWSPERNREAFGPLSDPPGHPHDYRCAVTVTGPLDPAMGMVVDLVELDGILQDEIVTPFEGRNLNQDVAEFAAGTLPTCESLAVLVYRRVAARLPAGVRLARVRVAEDATLHADCTGVL
ncbi:MAG TPA: 6-carboxytetrahydropterin synthase, partial [Gemmatimonadales bacterium]|nr:6-carboxytetrahydropterin synthase [Gemmatimonadales bacterium]